MQTSLIVGSNPMRRIINGKMQTLSVVHTLSTLTKMKDIEEKISLGTVYSELESK